MSTPEATAKGAVKTVRLFQFWNVLTDEWFNGENIAGSQRVPLDRVGSEVRGTNLPKNTEIVVYCGGPKCPQSHMAAEKLAKLGYENVRAYEGGLEEWKSEGFPVEKASPDDHFQKSVGLRKSHQERKTKRFGRDS